MSIFQRFWGNIPISHQSSGFRIFSAFFKRILHCLARYFPLMPSWRVALHRWRGVKIGKNIFIGIEVFIDDATPENVEIEDEVTIIAQCTILGHTYFPKHFDKLLRKKELSQSRVITKISKGSYIGLRSTILAGITIGEYSIVGAGSLVTKDVPPYSMVLGVPAKVVRTYEKSELII